VQNLRGTDGETYTQGWDGLADRCKKYYEQGARFAKWYVILFYFHFLIFFSSLCIHAFSHSTRSRRAVLKIDEHCPSDVAIAENARGLAMYGAICQVNFFILVVFSDSSSMQAT
tara:strand:- start:179 stop:520 length:342 start_codon:yes stop_codon:yes gene_type:complete